MVLFGAALVTPGSNSRFVTLWRGSFLEAAGLPGWAAPPNPQDSSAARQIPVTPPPMGWSSWNSFANLIDTKIVMQQTQALIDSGMAKSGYQYINIDEGWWLGERDAHGNIVVQPQQWPALTPGERPGDMSNIVRFIHRHGLKAGIYTDAGEDGCGFYGPDLGPPMPHTGSVNYYDQDFLQFARWGFDYVKVDWCGGAKHNLDPALQYAAVAHAIERAEKMTGRRLYYSICDWGNNSPWTWAPGIGGITADIWRTSGDIVPPIVANTASSNRLASFAGVLSNFDQGIHPAAEHTGFYNDPDMMVVGMAGLSEQENRVHMSLWAISGAPLLEGADLTKLSPATLAILTNPEIIAIDQDSLGVQAIKVDEPGTGLEVWTKPMPAAGEHAVLLLNRTPASPFRFEVRWDQIGLSPSDSASVRDAWTGKDLGSHVGSFATTVPAENVQVLIIRGSDGKAVRYEAAAAANELSEGAAPEACSVCSSGRSVRLGGEKSVTFNITPVKRQAFIRIAYVNRQNSPAVAQLSVSGETPINVLFPPTGESLGAVTLEVESVKPTGVNTLRFESRCGAGPELDSISVLP
jgi:hypothetical protein